MNPNATFERRPAAAPPSFRLAFERRAHTGILRHSPWDALLIGLALLHGIALVWVPSVPLIALGLWWNANTISHNFVHLPFFRARWANDGFSALLTLLLGIPQSLWAARHLAHHRDEPFAWRPVRRVWLAESALVLMLWSVLLMVAPQFFLTVYLPGWLLGLALCHLQGRFEHARGTTSHYGWIYNRLFFNDGYHVEHHARPVRHWTVLPGDLQAPQPNASPWPAVLRWLEYVSLDGLEELVRRWPWLQRWVLRTHEQALVRVLARIPKPRRIVIVGGGLFPRTALLLRRLVPEARLTIIDMRQDQIEKARSWLDDRVEFVRGYCTADNLPGLPRDTDLIIVPLALCGSKAGFYDTPPAPHVLVHDWLWHRRGVTAIVSCWLLKRINLVSPGRQPARD